MDRGFVRFNDDLTGGYWSWQERHQDASVIVKMPDRFDPGNCEQAVLDGLEQVRNRVRELLATDAESPSARVFQRRLNALKVEAE